MKEGVETCSDALGRMFEVTPLGTTSFDKPSRLRILVRPLSQPFSMPTKYTICPIELHIYEVSKLRRRQAVAPPGTVSEATRTGMEDMVPSVA